MKKFNKIMSLVLALAMMLSMVACGGTTEAPATEAPATEAPATEAPVAEYVDPYADLREDYDALSEAIYYDVLGDFAASYEASSPLLPFPSAGL